MSTHQGNSACRITVDPRRLVPTTKTEWAATTLARPLFSSLAYLVVL